MSAVTAPTTRTSIAEANMEIFEVHIAGDERIHNLGLKTITVELLKPDFTLLRIEHMTSQVIKCSGYQECLAKTLELAATLPGVVRTKIECPTYEHYVEQSLYMESHFETKTNTYPISRNQKKTELMGTERVYDHALYLPFRQKWLGQVVELCLYDTNTDEDKDWFSLWKQQ
jgi:hypothetical protein